MALSLLSSIELSRGISNGKSVTYIRKVTNIPIIQQPRTGELSGIEFRPLLKALDDPMAGPYNRKFNRQADTYAELVLGKDWRIEDGS